MRSNVAAGQAFRTALRATFVVASIASIVLHTQSCTWPYSAREEEHLGRCHRDSLSEDLSDECVELATDEDDALRAVASSILAGTTAIVERDKARMERAAEEAYAELYDAGMTEPPWRLCLKPVQSGNGSVTGTAIRPVSAPQFFLPDPWDCF